MENNKELLESIFNTNTGNTNTLEYLENITREHPYFTPAQFYLLLQTKKDNPAYGKQVQKTAALFNNNYWLNYLLTASYKPEPIFVQSSFQPAETIVDVKTILTAYNNIAPAENLIQDTAAITPIVNETVENEIINYEPAAAEPVTDEVISVNEPALIMEATAENNDTDYSELAEKDLSQVIPESTAKDEAVLDEPIKIQEELSGMEESLSLKTDEPVSEEEEKINVPAEISGGQVTTNSFDSEIIDESIGLQLPEPGADKTNETPPVVLENEISFQNKTFDTLIKNRTNEPESLKQNTVDDTSAEALLFQPLYTSDYFASVGIKLSEEANGSDRLGKQLKSFTQWLKTMKKIDSRNTDPLLPAEIASENIDANIQNLAEKSNKDDEVVTEAMADVLVQQGRINKAVELLKKLSLLNPSKSTYFAAKIEQLKD